MWAEGLFKVQGSGVQGFRGSGVQGFRVWGLGFRVRGKVFGHRKEEKRR